MAQDLKDKVQGFALAKENLILLAIGFAIIVLGYILMIGGGTEDPNVFNGKELYSFRRITLSPIVIVLGFIIDGYAIMAKPESIQKLFKLFGKKSEK